MTIARMKNRKRPLPPIEDLLREANRIYKYDQENGGLIWKAYTRDNSPGKAKLGKQVGGDDGHGYRMCMLLGHKFKVHQVVWMMHNGMFPPSMIDHADRNKRNNRIGNLRLANEEQNGFNRLRGDNLGIHKEKRGHGYVARIQNRGRKHYLGYFKTPEEAREAYIQESRRIRGRFSPV